MRSAAVLLVLALCATPALAQKVNVTYAEGFDFDALETFRYVETEETDAVREEMDELTEEMIRSRLVEGGLREVEGDADILVTYHFVAEERQSINTTAFGYGGEYGPDGPQPSASTPGATVYSYTEGTLVIDGYEPAGNKVVWHGTGTVEVGKTEKKQVQQLERILDKLTSRWQKILRKKAAKEDES